MNKLLLLLLPLIACNTPLTEDVGVDSNSTEAIAPEETEGIESPELAINFEKAMDSKLLHALPLIWVQLSGIEGNWRILSDQWAGSEQIRLDPNDEGMTVYIGNDVSGYDLQVTQVEWRIDNDTIWLYRDDEQANFKLSFCWSDKDAGVASWHIADDSGDTTFFYVSEENEGNYETEDTGSLPPEEQY